MWTISIGFLNEKMVSSRWVNNFAMTSSSVRQDAQNEKKVASQKMPPIDFTDHATKHDLRLA